MRRSTDTGNSPDRCKDRISAKNFTGVGAGARGIGRPLHGPKRGPRIVPPPAGQRRRPPLRRPRDISNPSARRFSLSRRGPPFAQRLSRRRRAHYRGQPRSRPLGDFKTMPDYGASPGTPEQAVIVKIKTAGRRLAHSVKFRVWTAGPGPAP